MTTIGFFLGSSSCQRKTRPTRYEQATNTVAARETVLFMMNNGKWLHDTKPHLRCDNAEWRSPDSLREPRTAIWLSSVAEVDPAGASWNQLWRVRRPDAIVSTQTSSRENHDRHYLDERSGGKMDAMKWRTVMIRGII
ncbi:MAG: hypothetical protein MUE50_24915, partial [Pirellulaceae bacterium]|nr:hypothetical protein [Pirellulaceae bacterium]